MATRKTTKATTGTKTNAETKATTGTKTNAETKATTIPNALSTSTTNNSSDAITNALKHLQATVTELRGEIETLKASSTVNTTNTTNAVKSTNTVTNKDFDSLLTILTRFCNFQDRDRAVRYINKWRNGQAHPINTIT